MSMRRVILLLCRYARYAASDVVARAMILRTEFNGDDARDDAMRYASEARDVYDGALALVTLYVAMLSGEALSNRCRAMLMRALFAVMSSSV